MHKTILSLLFGSSLAGLADVTLPKILTSNMVLQRDQPITLWGWAEAGEKVKVSLAGKKQKTTADAKGDWKVTFPPQGLGEPVQITVEGNNRIVLDDVLLGDVWLCSGQSNMEWGVGTSEHADEAIAAADHPTLRLFDVGKVSAKKPLKDIAKGSGWKVCTPESVAQTGTVKGFSAAAYFFGKHLQRGLKTVPIGLVDASWGGTRIEPWTTTAGRDSVESLKGSKGKYSGLYNGMVHGLAPLRVKGCIWYQGEANRKDGALYYGRMCALINGWRAIWGEKMPFYFVQLAPFAYAKDKNPEILPVIWEAQSKTNHEVPYTGMAVTIDVGNPKNIHPKKKEEVGQRLALLALRDSYGQDVEAYSPSYHSHQQRGRELTLRFKDEGAGLSVREGGQLEGFELAAADGTFVAVKARVSGKNTVQIQLGKIKEPKVLRYAWSNTPKASLVSRNGLPVAAFRIELER